MQYDEAMAFLEETKKYGSRPGLATIRALLHELGDVEECVPVVHIGGTNGKGSVGAMLSAVLTEAGCKVGWFNTPDVFSYEEEFRINGLPIEKERLAQLFTEVQEACERLNASNKPDSALSEYESLQLTHVEAAKVHSCVTSYEAKQVCLHPTRFEVETAAAFLWFYEESCDLALIEVGMGGALDATNLIKKPLVSVLTSIGRDHTQFLGDTLAEIAAAKAGIIKPGCPVVTVLQEPEGMQVIRARCEALHAPLFVADSDFAFQVLRQRDGGRGGFSANGENTGKNREHCHNNRGVNFPENSNEICRVGEETDRLQEKEPGVVPSFREENASCARQVLEVLRTQYPERFFGLADAAISSGLAKARWPGRYECLRLPGTDGTDGPLLLLDGAHNPPAAQRLREALDADFPNRTFHYIMGVFSDKDYESMARILFRPGDRVCTVTPPTSRALSATALAEALCAQNVAAHPCASVRDALSYIRNEAKEKDLIVALGSLSYLASLKQAL